ncbi:MAG: insulinase family protein [Planctomycetaceae bacterium]|nr:insulinase family protein [Planctomycetaceae bacterium]
MTFRRLVLMAVMSLGLGQSVFAADVPEKVVTVEGVTEYKYPNGARVLLFPEDSQPTITVNMTVLVGSRHEGYGEAGMAHLLEHLVFKGTPTFPEVPKALRDHGASFNGTTNQDRTNYFETLPATDENLDFAIHMECDRLVNSFIDRNDLLSEFTVVRNEFERGENSPEGVLFQRVMAAAYEWHNYGKTTIGNRSDIERVPIDNLQAFYRKYYQPDNVVLIVTGRFEEAKALELTTKYLGSIPKPERKLDPTYTEEPPQDGDRTVILKRVGKLGSVAVAYHMPAAAHEDWAPLSILGSIISETKVGRLDQALVETQLATSASGRSDRSHDPGLFTFSASPTEGNLEKVRDILLQTIEHMGDKPFTAEEVDRAKLRAKRMSDQMMTNASGVASMLSSAASIGDWRLMFLLRDRTQAVTVDDVNRVAKTYFQPHNRTLGLFIPTDTPQRMSIPSVPSIADVVKDYKGGAAVAAGEAFDPSPENLDARTTIVEQDGVRIAMLPKKNRGETVNMTLTLRYGNEESLKDNTVAASMLSSMLMAGTSKLDRQALQQEMDKLDVRIGGGFGGGGGRGRRGGGGGGGGGAGSLSFSIEARKSSLEKGIMLLGQILRDPAFPETEFEQMKIRAVDGISRGETEPDALAAELMSRSLSQYPKGDVRYSPTMKESVEMAQAVTLDQVKDIYKKQLSAATGEIAIVGDFEPEAALSAIREVLHDWKSDVPYKPVVRDAKPDLTGSKSDIVTPDKANALFLAGLSFTMNDEDPDSIALQLGNFILGGGTLSSRLGDRIRQKEGLSYGVTSSVSIPSRGTDARFAINAITNPANINAVEKAAFEELNRFITDGPTEKEVAEAKVAWLEARKVSRTSDGAIAGRLASNLYLDRSFARDAAEEKRIEALTADQIKAAFQKYVAVDKLIVIRAGDFRTEGAK